VAPLLADAALLALLEGLGDLDAVWQDPKARQRLLDLPLEAMRRVTDNASMRLQSIYER
jgi:hypothetical protein